MHGIESTRGGKLGERTERSQSWGHFASRPWSHGTVALAAKLPIRTCFAASHQHSSPPRGNRLPLPRTSFFYTCNPTDSYRQAFPGPNFNFSLALGFLALSSLPSPSLSQSIGGSLLGYIGIFLPGLLLMLAFLPIYSIFRLHPIARATIRGLNAAATGLVWVAVWQLFLVGHIYVGATGTTGGTEGETRALSGPLTADPWWAVVASGSFLACRNYGLPPWAGVLGGGAAGALWYAATRS